MDPTHLLLVALLGSPSFDTREAAEQALSRQGGAAWAVLQLAALSPDAVVRLRAGRLSVEAVAAGWEAWAQRHAPFPWIDALPLDYPGRCAAIQNYRSIVQSTPGPGVPNVGPTFLLDQEAGRLLFRDLWDTVPIAETERLLDRMRRRMLLWDHAGCTYRD
jgi:hypothetical protein